MIDTKGVTMVDVRDKIFITTVKICYLHNSQKPSSATYNQSCDFPVYWLIYLSFMPCCLPETTYGDTVMLCNKKDMR